MMLLTVEEFNVSKLVIINMLLHVMSTLHLKVNIQCAMQDSFKRPAEYTRRSTGEVRINYG